MDWEVQITVSFARVLHDWQWLRDDKGHPVKSRLSLPTRGGAWPKDTLAIPETCPLFVSPSGGKDDLELGPWHEYLHQLNDERSFKFITSPPAGLFNRNTKADTLTFGGNVVEIMEVKNGAARIKTFDLNSAPPDPAEYNFGTHPELVQKFVAVTRSGSIINPAEGIDVYTFLIGRRPMWISLSRLERFPALPMYIHNLPILKKTLRSYLVRGVTVYGRTGKDTVVLRQATRPEFPTNWNMRTEPPLRPKTAY